MKTPQELSVFLGRTRNAAYQWGEYLPPLATYELLEMCPELRRLIENDLTLAAADLQQTRRSYEEEE